MEGAEEEREKKENGTLGVHFTFLFRLPRLLLFFFFLSLAERFRGDRASDAVFFLRWHDDGGIDCAILIAIRLRAERGFESAAREGDSGWRCVFFIYFFFFLLRGAGLR